MDTQRLYKAKGSVVRAVSPHCTPPAEGRSSAVRSHSGQSCATWSASHVVPRAERTRLPSIFVMGRVKVNVMMLAVLVRRLSAIRDIAARASRIA